MQCVDLQPGTLSRPRAGRFHHERYATFPSCLSNLRNAHNPGGFGPIFTGVHPICAILLGGDTGCDREDVIPFEHHAADAF